MRKNHFMMSIVFSLFLFLNFSTSNALAYNEESYYNYIKNLFDQHDQKFMDATVSEMNKYLNLFPQGKHRDEVQYLIGAVYDEKKEEEHAVAAFLKTLYLYPASKRKTDTIDNIRRIVLNEKKFKDYRDEILSFLTAEFKPADEPTRYYDYIVALYDLNYDGLFEWTIKECHQYLNRFPDSPKAAEVQQRLGNLHLTEKQYHDAVAAFLRLEYLFPSSPYVADSKLSMGNIYFNELKNDLKASETYKSVIDKFPGSKHAAKAQYKLGQLTEERLKDPAKAMVEYQRVVDNYPQVDDVVVDALFARAVILEDEVKDYKKAIAEYSKVVESYPENAKAPEALNKKGEIYESKLDLFEQAIMSYKAIADSYPKNELAPMRLYDSAVLYDRKLRRYESAIELYRMVTEKFPDTEYAKRAGRRLKRLKDKLQEE